MTDDFQFIGTESALDCFITIAFRSSRMNKGMARALGNPKFVTVEVNSELVVRVSACDENHPQSINVDASFQLGKIGPFARRNGLRGGKHSVEIRDGAAYFQMEKLA